MAFSSSGVVESGTSQITINSIDGYKNPLITDATTGQVINGGVTHFSVDSEETPGNNEDQGTDDTDFDVPNQGVGYYLVAYNSTTGLYRYANPGSAFFNELTESSGVTTRARISSLELASQTVYQLRYYGFSGHSTINESRAITSVVGTGTSLSNNGTITVPAGDYKVWLDTANYEIGFETLSNVQTSIDTRQNYPRGPKNAISGTHNVVYYTGGTWNLPKIYYWGGNGGPSWDGSPQMHYLNNGQSGGTTSSYWWYDIGNNTNYIFRNNAGNAKSDDKNYSSATPASNDGNNTYSAVSFSAIGSGKRVFLFADSGVSTDSATFKIKYGNSPYLGADKANEDNFSMTKIAGTDYWYYDLPSSAIFFRFQRLNSSGTTVWNETNVCVFNNSYERPIMKWYNLSGGETTGHLPESVSIKREQNSWAAESLTFNSLTNTWSIDTQINANKQVYIYALWSLGETTERGIGYSSRFSAFADPVDGNANLKIKTTGKYRITIGINVWLYDDKTAIWGSNDSSDITQLFDVTFNANGHGTAPSSQTIVSGGKVIEPSAPTATGYTFGGWYEEPGCTNQWNFSTGTISANKTLYAKWTPYSYTVVFHKNDGAAEEETVNQSFDYDESKALTANSFAAPSGKAFSGWATTAARAASGTVDYEDGETVTNLRNTDGATFDLYAVWVTWTFTLAYSGNGNTGGSDPTGDAIGLRPVGESVSIVSNPYSKTGYVFDGWDIVVGGVDKGDISKNAETHTFTTGEVGSNNSTVTLRAKWELGVYQITLNERGATTSGTTTVYEKYNTGYYLNQACSTAMGTSSNPIASLPRKTGYTFGGYYTNSDGTGTQYINASGYITASAVTTYFTAPGNLYAKWTLNSWAVNISAGNGVTSVKLSAKNDGTSLVNSGATFDYGVPVYAYAVLRDGWAKQNSWVLISGSTYRVATYNGLDDAVHSFGSINAETVTYNILYDMGEGTAISPGSYTISNAQQEVSLSTNSTRTGYNFYSYSILQGNNTSGSNSSIISGPKIRIPANAYGDVTVTASWTLKTTTITFSWQSGTGGTSSVTATYSQAMPAITAPTRVGYDFRGYFTQEDGAGTKYYNADQTSARNWDIEDSEKTLYAYWVLTDFTITLNNGGFGDNGQVTQVHYDSAMPSISAPSYSGKVFLGYYTEADGGGDVYYNYNGTSAHSYSDLEVITLYAYWGETSTSTYFLAGTTYYFYNSASDWQIGNERFAVYLFDKTNSRNRNMWVDLETAGTNLYSVTIPYGQWNGLIFVRMNGGTSENNWDNKWNQTPDQLRSTAGSHLFFAIYGSKDGEEKYTGTWFSAIVSGQKLLLTFNDATVRTNWEAASAVAILRLYNGSSTIYLEGTPLLDRNGNTDSYLFEIPEVPVGQWWINLQYLRVNPSYYSGHENDPSFWYENDNGSKTWNHITPSSLPTSPNNTWKITSQNLENDGSWLYKVLKDPGWYLVGSTNSSDPNHPLILNGGNNWDLEGATLWASYDASNDAIWADINLEAGDMFKLVNVYNYSPTWYGYRSNQPTTNASSLFIDISNNQNIKFATSGFVSANVSVYYAKNAGPYVVVHSYVTTALGKGYSGLSSAADSDGDKAAYQITVSTNNGGSVYSIDPASPSANTYFEFNHYATTNSKTGSAAVGASLTSSMLSFYAIFVRQTVDITIALTTDGENPITITTESYDKGKQRANNTYTYSNVYLILDSINGVMTGFEQGDDKKLYTTAACSEAYTVAAITSNLTLYVKTAEKASSTIYVDLKHSNTTGENNSKWGTLKVTSTNGQDIYLSYDALSSNWKVAQDLYRITVPTNWDFRLTDGGNTTDTNGYRWSVVKNCNEVGATDVLLVAVSSGVSYNHDGNWCSNKAPLTAGSAIVTITNSSEVTRSSTTMFPGGGIANNYFVYERGVRAYTGDKVSIAVSGTSSDWNIDDTYDTLGDFVGETSWFLETGDSGDPITLNTDCFLNFYVTTDNQSNPKISIAAVPVKGNGYYIMKTTIVGGSYATSNNIGYEGGVKMFSSGETSASYNKFHINNGEAIYIRSYVHSTDSLCNSWNYSSVISKINTSLTESANTGILVFDSTNGAGDYTITVSGKYITIVAHTADETFKLNGFNPAASIYSQDTSLLLEVTFTVKNSAPVVFSCNVTNGFVNNQVAYVGAALYVSATRITTGTYNATNYTSAYQYMRLAHYSNLSGASVINFSTPIDPPASGDQQTLYAYILIDYLEAARPMPESLFGQSISFSLVMTQYTGA